MRVLFVCTENTCRSQMAEGFAKDAALDAESGGLTSGAGVNEDAILVMKEAGIDISEYTAKQLDKSKVGSYDAVISMCAELSAKDLCPPGFGGLSEDWRIEDPRGKSLEEYRQVRDSIAAKVQELYFRAKHSGAVAEPTV